jgi:hypothetical protein
MNGLPLVPPSPPRSKRGRRVIASASLALILGGTVLLAWTWMRSHNAQRELQEAIAEADRLDPGWRLLELEAHRKAVPAELDAAPLLTRLGPAQFNVLNKGTVRQDLARIDEQINIHNPRMGLTPQQAGEFRAALEPLGQCLVEGRKVASLPEGRFATNVRAELNWTIANHDWASCTAWLLKLDVLLRIQDDDIDGAWESCQASLNAMRALGDEPLWPIQGRRTKGAGEAVALMERALAHGSVPEKPLAGTQALLRAELNHPALLIALRGGRAQVDHCFDLLESGKASLSEAKRLFSFKSGPGDVVEQVHGFLGMPEVVPAHAWLLRFHTRAVEIGKRPEPECMAALDELEQTLADAPPLARELSPKFPRVRFLIHNRAVVACGIAGLAVERFRLLHERWPASLDEVVAAKLLDQVPADPLDGKPLRFRPTRDGVVVYSIGLNGHGNGDALDVAGEGAVGPGERAEFRLWNVERRGAENR